MRRKGTVDTPGRSGGTGPTTRWHVAGSHEWPEGWSRGGSSGGGGTRRPDRDADRAPRPDHDADRTPRPDHDADRTQVLRPPVRTATRPPRARRTAATRRPRPRSRGAATTRRRRSHGRRPSGGGGRRLVRRVLLALLLVVVLARRHAVLLLLADREGRRPAGLRRPTRCRRPAPTGWSSARTAAKGLTDEQVKDLHLGKVGGRRTDTIILLHKPASGAPTLVSLPRDSYVPIPGHGREQAQRGLRLRRARRCWRGPSRP